MISDKSRCSATSNDYIDFLTNNYLSYDDMYRDMVKANTARNYQYTEVDLEKYINEVPKDYREVAVDDDIDLDSLIEEYKKGGYDPYHMPIGVKISNYPSYEDETQAYYRPNHRNMEEDKSEDDIEFMKGMYPRASRLVLQSIEEECDKLEYEGSCMFDEYPDRTNISRIILRIYENVKDMSFKENDSKVSEVEIKEFCYDRYCPYNRCIDCCDDGSPNWLCQMIQTMFFQEMINRRRRYRYRRWR